MFVGKDGNKKRSRPRALRASVQTNGNVLSGGVENLINGECYDKRNYKDDPET